MFGLNKKEQTKKDAKSFINAAPKNANGYHCRSCKHCIECGDGSFSCNFGKPKLIVRNGETTQDYYWCIGRGYESKN